jgi:hypothetical protein
MDNGINIGEGIPNLTRLKRDLLRTDSCTEFEFLALAKKIFDANLPDGYDKLTMHSGMSYYWAEVYKNFFELLGFTGSIYQISATDGSHMYEHVWLTITLEDYTLEVDRQGVYATPVGRASRLRGELKHRFIQVYATAGVISLMPEVSWEDNSTIIIPQSVLTELSIYADTLVNGDIELLQLKPLRGLLTWFSLMYTFATNSAQGQSMSLKELKKEKEARIKYKIPFFKEEL